MTDAREFNPTAGVGLSLATDLRLLLAPNPSPMTDAGTNTYILGQSELIVIDPGPNDQNHLSALLAEIGDRPVSHILVTHSHKDHSPLARQLSDKTNAPVYGFGDSQSGRSDAMIRASNDGLETVGEGVDHDFQPDMRLICGQTLATSCGPIKAIHTPGHLGNHMCFSWQDVIFSGDHVMEWASSMISPPDGDVRDFITSCARLKKLEARILYPGHGAPVYDPHARIDWLIGHRRQREREILGALKSGPATAFEIATQLYESTPAPLLKAAERNVLAHLIDLTDRAIIAPLETLSSNAVFYPIDHTTGSK